MCPLCISTLAQTLTIGAPLAIGAVAALVRPLRAKPLDHNPDPLPEPGAEQETADGTTENRFEG